MITGQDEEAVRKLEEYLMRNKATMSEERKENVQ
jgi:hypothetical protein